MWKLMFSDGTSIDVKETRKVIRVISLLGSPNHIAVEVNTGHTINLRRARELEDQQKENYCDKCE